MASCPVCGLVIGEQVISALRAGRSDSRISSIRSIGQYEKVLANSKDEQFVVIYPMSHGIDDMELHLFLEVARLSELVGSKVCSHFADICIRGTRQDFTELRERVHYFDASSKWIGILDAEIDRLFPRRKDASWRPLNKARTA
jgi:hypothetical protein